MEKGERSGGSPAPAAEEQRIGPGPAATLRAHLEIRFYDGEPVSPEAVIDHDIVLTQLLTL